MTGGIFMQRKIDVLEIFNGNKVVFSFDLWYHYQ